MSLETRLVCYKYIEFSRLCLIIFMTQLKRNPKNKC